MLFFTMTSGSASHAPPVTGAPPSRLRVYAGILGAAASFAVGFGLDAPSGHPHVPAMAAVALLMAVYWIFDVLPIAVTSLLPIALFPLLGVASPKVVGAAYGKPTVFLFMGGFILALGIERAGLHRRIALAIVSFIGSRPARLVLGFMVASGLLSMWISNTATVMVMLPIAAAVLRSHEEDAAAHGATPVPGFGTALMLGIAYAANIGGMGTLIGTPPNLAYRQILHDTFEAAPEVSFTGWMLLGLPLAVVFIALAWVLLTRVLFRFPDASAFGERAVVADARRALGPVRRDEVLAGLVFGLVALLWITGGSGKGDVPGWRDLPGLAQVGDEVVAMAGAILLFAIPSKDRRGALMDWPTAVRLPWGILLLFGGGFALAAGFESSGLSNVIGGGLSGLRGLPPWVIVVIVSVVMTFLTELTSNTATANLVLPILGKAAVVMGVDPRTLMVPATLSASCAFMMPVATPTNAIVFGTGHITIPQMARAGLWLNLLGVALITAFFFLLGTTVLDIAPSVVPAWAGGAP
ncbi:MAG: SLC13/DASS family transporter [Deltaproteobacteria bacterium]|nr:MAG: SLC13/DASS family transporter [Deltaproteobacteria bacterium]